MQSHEPAAVPEKVRPISERYQRLAEAEMLMIERIRLKRRSDLSDEEYVKRSLELDLREVSWAKRWGIV